MPASARGDWTDDGSLDGTIEQKYWAVRTFGHFAEADCIELKATDRARIQMIYVPASRDGASQVTAFLRGRLGARSTGRKPSGRRSPKRARR